MAFLLSSSVSSIMIFLLLFFLFFFSHCYADSNVPVGSMCSNPSEAELSSSWKENLNSLFGTLEANVILNNGYYKAEAGTKGPDKVYGLIQCRGDISKSNCTNCTRESFNSSSSCNIQGRSKSVVIWHRWCLLHYSDENFYGVWDRSRFGVYPSNSSNVEEPGPVVDKGPMMMTGLAAAAPKESLMFAKGEMDDGNGGKRYGLAQCTRDLGKSDCRDCLEYLIGDFLFGFDKRSWGIYATGCFMLYDDTQFYFNISTEEGLGGARPPNAANREFAGRLATAITIFMAAIAFL